MESKKWIQKAVPESHEGLFTAKAKAAGMGVQAYARHVVANPKMYDQKTVHQANFAITMGHMR